MLSHFLLLYGTFFSVVITLMKYKICKVVNINIKCCECWAIQNMKVSEFSSI